MLSCQITIEKLIFSWPSELTRKGNVTRSLPRPKNITLQHVKMVVKSLTSICQRQSDRSYGGFITATGALFSISDDKSWPNSQDVQAWQDLVIEIFKKILNLRSVNYETRLSYWASISKIYKELKAIGVLPEKVRFPSTARLSGTQSPHEETPPLGYKQTPIQPASAAAELLPKCFLIERNLDLSDDMYLSNFRDELQGSCDKLSDALIGYWDDMLETHALGKKLIEEIPKDELMSVIQAGTFIVSGRHVCHPSNPLAINWFLAIIQYYLEEEFIVATTSTVLRTCSFGKSLKQRWLRNLRLKAKSLCPRKYLNATATHEYLNRLIGHLSTQDCQAAAALLVMNNPVFTPEGICLANLYQKNNDSYLVVDTEQDRVKFSISKPRAYSRKHAYLNTISRKIILNVLEATSKLRHHLKAIGRSDWKRLFIYVSGQGVNTCPNNNSLSGNKNSLQERLDSPLGRMSDPHWLSLKTIRATQGILTFLRTGSLVVTALVLGNSPAVVESNYVPGWLSRRFANRTLRILQQKLVVVAVARSPWLLAASDFESHDDLHIFICRILNEATGSDPFSKVARQRLAQYSTVEDSTESPANGNLVFQISPEEIAAVYAYADCCSKLPLHEQIRIRPETGQSPRTLADVAELLRRCAAIDLEASTEMDILIASRFVGDSFGEIKKAHERATVLAPKYSTLFMNAIVK
ncbi:hypothetical protein QN412_23815 [Pseudomonas sp. RTB3]|uniref:hypothetical protein n=1 Tax=unclassified Pseudomonas TaxID=196821 RepID=UPI002B2355E5|nr:MULTISPECIES: hypothetical protein [unclassified Pseudomonas]MEB0008543.1 hypothetical protein [Pseudomonas sp. RTB2]MEB0019953.1 hypothetical protein [Pseudomonas sp. RTB3]MEB0272751.1 hypothetical protein [Pseudomonas sp. 5B4]